MRVDVATGGVIVAGADDEVVVPGVGDAAGADAALGVASDFALTHLKNRTFGDRDEAA